ncbi:MAG: hypothetical protein ACFFG0_01550 [Candidatus Thorarchaeota archaeon]
MGEKSIEEIQQSKIDNLLLEFENHRKAIKDMIIELETIRGKVDRLIPENLDARYARLFEEKVKSITAFFNSLLEMRKEIAKSVKDEIEIRRKIKDKDKLDFDDLLDVRKMAKKVDEFRNESDKIKDERLTKTKEQKVDKSIEIPGINDEKKGIK